MSVKIDGRDSLKALLANLPKPDGDAMGAARARQDSLTKPQGALGRLEDIAVFMAGWGVAEIAAPLCLVFAGNHGVVAQGVSAFPASVTTEMVKNFQQGGAAINALTEAAGCRLAVHPIDLDTPTRDFTIAPAMDEAEMFAAMQIGADALTAHPDCDMLLPGEMGIGNTTSAAALSAACLGGEVSEWTGRGTGIDDAALTRKIAAIEKALTLHGDAITRKDGVAIMAALGGRELAALAGAVLAARLRGIPVLLDGFVATAALLPLWLETPDIFAHCLAAHRSAEAGHGMLLERIGQVPLLDFGMRLGEASGAALALPLIRSALAVHNGMASFDEAGVSNKTGGKDD